MLERLNPTTAPKPFSRYSQTVLAPQDSEWLYISGQVGCDRERNIVEGFEAQADLAWGNLANILKSAGFGVEDLAKVTVLLTRAEDAPASPAMLIEVEGVAARSAGSGGA